MCFHGEWWILDSETNLSDPLGLAGEGAGFGGFLRSLMEWSLKEQQGPEARSCCGGSCPFTEVRTVLFPRMHLILFLHSLPWMVDEVMPRGHRGAFVGCLSEHVWWGGGTPHLQAGSERKKVPAAASRMKSLLPGVPLLLGTMPTYTI